MSSLVFISLHIANQKEEWQKLYMNRGRLLSRVFSNLSMSGVYLQNRPLINRQAGALLENQNVKCLKVYSNDDSIIYEHNRDADQVSSVSWPGMRAIKKRFENNDPMPVIDQGDHSVFFAPIVFDMKNYTDEGRTINPDASAPDGSIIGYVAVAVYKTAFSSNVRRILIEDVLLHITIFAFGMIIILLLVGRWIRPLSNLAGAVAKFGQDRSFEKLPVAGGSDEVGRITEAFNTMAETIMARDAERSRIEAKLRHSQKMESVGTMAGGIAHDFRNILTAIIGFANILKLEMGKDNPSRQYIDHILATSARATKLIQGLLTYSRKQIMDQMPVNINRLISDLENIIKRIVRADIRLDLRLSEGDLIAAVDQGQIEQLLINICTNARDAMPGGGTLGISTARRRLATDSFKGFSPLTTGY